MDYKKLLNKITHVHFNGGEFEYYGATVNVTMGRETMGILIRKDRDNIAQFDFTFEIPRHITFWHEMKETAIKKICDTLNEFYEEKIPFSIES